MRNVSTMKNEFFNAIKSDDYLRVSLLLREGISINTRITPDMSNALFVAIALSNLKMVKFLVENGINIHASNSEGDTPLSLSVSQPQIFEYLLSAGADTSQPDKDDIPIMFKAVDNMDNYLMTTLAAYGEGINVQNDDGNTPLMIAIQNKITIQIKMILDLKPDPFITNMRGQTALDIAVEGNTPGIVQILETYARKMGLPTSG